MKVLITGGLSNLGSAIAKVFYENGWDVFVTSREKKNFEYGSVLEMDLENAESISECRKHFDSLDVLINNAGIFTEGLQENLPEEDFDSACRSRLYTTF